MHHDVRQIAFRAPRVDLADIRMANLGGRPGFAKEPGAETGRHAVRVRHFDRDFAFQFGIKRAIDTAEGSFAEHSANLEATESLRYSRRRGEGARRGPRTGLTFAVRFRIGARCGFASWVVG